MSKPKRPSEPAPDPSTPAECVPTRAPLGECHGKRVKCPSCGKPAAVVSARGAVHGGQAVSSKFWARLDCTGCGPRLEKMSTVVEVEQQPAPPPISKPLGHVIGHRIKCPKCGQVAKPAWTIEDGHLIDCPQCQRRVTPSDTLVELVA